MKKEKNIFLRQNKGITLISLIVTIIVLLLLAGVSVMTLAGENGLINRAISAKDKTELAGIQEELQVAVEALRIDYYISGADGTIGSYVATHEVDLQNSVGDSTLTVDEDRITYKGLQFIIDTQTGKVDLGETTWVYDSEEDVITDGTVKLKVGDYVNYNPMSNGTEGTTYTSYSTTNASSSRNNGRNSGCSENQTFDAKNM